MSLILLRLLEVHLEGLHAAAAPACKLTRVGPGTSCNAWTHKLTLYIYKYMKTLICLFIYLFLETGVVYEYTVACEHTSIAEHLRLA